MPLMSNSTLYTSQNIPLTLDKKIGEGGEGYVCTVKDINGKEASGQFSNQLSNQVAKIYHISHLPDNDKQDKLRYMVANSDKDLLSYIAWATDTLHKRKGGRIIGFLMPKIADCSPIHTLYNPSHRRQSFPTVTWKFLLYTARNVASAIDTLHKKGHVIGDINQGNLLFSKNSKVTLIDADSFQITTPTTTHLSLVGVAHFTPPELQGNSNFDTIARTQNHDNFGLAVLIFHLLFGGRHPFAGVPLIDEAGHLLENDIKAYRYAYAPDHSKRGMKPPPFSIPIDIVPKKVQALFVQAFTEVGSIRGSKQRPTAEMWMDVLDGLRDKVVTCNKHKQHDYLNHLSSCPWCELEDKGVVYFGQHQKQQQLLNLTHKNNQRPIDHTNIRQKTQSLFDDFHNLKPLSVFSCQRPTNPVLTPKSLPEGMQRPSKAIDALIYYAKAIAFTLWLICLPFTAMLVGGFIVFILHWMFGDVVLPLLLFVIILGISTVAYSLPKAREWQNKKKNEYNQREATLIVAERSYQQFCKKMNPSMKDIRLYEMQRNHISPFQKEFDNLKSMVKDKDTQQVAQHRMLKLAKELQPHIQTMQQLQNKLSTQYQQHKAEHNKLARELTQAEVDFELIKNNMPESF